MGGRRYPRQRVCARIGHQFAMRDVEMNAVTSQTLTFLFTDIVDASVFPRIPGLFIVSAVYMIGETAAQGRILHNAGQ